MSTLGTDRGGRLKIPVKSGRIELQLDGNHAYPGKYAWYVIKGCAGGKRKQRRFSMVGRLVLRRIWGKDPTDVIKCCAKPASLDLGVAPGQQVLQLVKTG
jgi:hypothetical protein